MNRNVVGLLGMIHDIAHNHDETKLSLMAIIELDMELYLGFQGPTEPCDEYMAVFKARIDTINMHRGLAGKHPGHFKETFTRITEERELTKETIWDMNSDGKKVLPKEIQEMARENTLPCFSPSRLMALNTVN